MRTTLTLTPEVAALVRDCLKRLKKSNSNITMKDLINRALFRGLSELDKPINVTSYKTKPYKGGKLLIEDTINIGETLARLDDDVSY